jgi:hypothetical protein
MDTCRMVIDYMDMEKDYRKSKKIWDRYFKMCEIDRQKYYEGFNVGREKQMFKEELEDLETVYKTALKNYHQEVEDVLPSLLHYMEKFLILHKQNEAIREKLDVLLEKTGKQSQEEDGDNE